MTPPPIPLEQFAAIRLCLCQFVARQTGWGISLQLIALIIAKIRTIGQRFARLVARIEAGTYTPRRPPATPRKTAASRPRPPSKLPLKFAWLLPLVPGAACFGGQLETLFRTPEMAALLAAAPEPMGRVLRPLCWMLGVTPPPILAWRRKTPPPAPPAPPAAPGPKPPRQRRVWPPPEAPAWMQGLRRSIRLPKSPRPPKSA